MSTLRHGTIVSDLSTSKTAPSSSYIALDLLFHISSFSKLLVAADVLDIVGSPTEKAAFSELKSLIILMIQSNEDDLINIHPFLEKLSAWTMVDYCQIDQNDVLRVWDDIVKLIMVVIPPLREVFLGQVSSALEASGWVNLMPRCFHAEFSENINTLEDVYLNSLTSVPSTPASSLKSSVLTADGNADQQGATVSSAATAMDKMRIANAMVLRRAPEILVISIESSLIEQSSSPSNTAATRGPQAILYPETFDLAHYSPSHIANNNSNSSNGSAPHNSTHSPEHSKLYDLSVVVALEGNAFDSLHPYFRIAGSDMEYRWYKGAGFEFEEVPRSRAIEGNFYCQASEKKVHPRLLVYTRRDLPSVLERTLHLVSKAGQMRALGDVAFALAMTTCENYGEARRCYEDAIALDEGLRAALQENLSSLEKIERTQRARVLEEQADLALANKRFREASELYSKGMMNAVVSSGVYLRVRDKLESVTHIIALDSACQFAEKGEEALKLGLLPNAKDLYSQAYKLNPEFLHLHTILVGIDKTVQMLNAGQRIADAQTAAKAYHYKLANHFYREAIALVPEKLAGLQSTLDSLAPLMQGEDALMRQKSGLAAMEDKRYTAAIQLFTEAIGLLPKTQASCLEHAVFLCDRALAHYDLKDFNTAVADCTLALQLKPELAIAHFRLGAAQFGLDQFDLASSSYDRALKCDPSLSESVKVKIRQVTSAREIQQRKERETERAKLKEEEKKIFEEKKARDDILKKEREKKLAIVQAEKAERNRIKEEERKAKAALEKELEKEKEIEKEAEKERLRVEKVERDALKAQEREKARIEKEKERERVRLEKEQKAIDSRRALEEEKKRKIEFNAEVERNAAKQREAERDREAEKERARLERERIIAEREKARKEKLELEALKSAAEAPLSTTLSTPAHPATSSAQHEVTSQSPGGSKSEGFKVPVGRKNAEYVLGAGAGAGVSAHVGGGVNGNAQRWSGPSQSSAVAHASTAVGTSSNGGVSASAMVGVGGEEEVKISNGSSSNHGGGSKNLNSKVWTASKHSADTITRVPTAAVPSSSSPSRQKAVPPSTDSLADFPKLGDSHQASHKTVNVNESVTEILNPDCKRVKNLDPDSRRGKTLDPVEDDQELGWSALRSQPQQPREPIAPSPSSTAYSSSLLSSSNDIFSSMAERPSMSTDYTFKPSERTIKAAEAKRLADSQQKAAAAAAAMANTVSMSSSNSNTPSMGAKGDFDEFLCNSSASYISNFSSSIRYNPANPADITQNNGLFFSAPSPLGSGRPSRVSPSNYADQGPTFSHSFSGLGFSSSFLSSSGDSSSALSAAVGVGGGSLGLGGGLGMGMSRRESANGMNMSDEIDDDFNNNYFNSPLASLVGLDLDDVTDPLLMAIGGLSMSPSDSPTASHLSPSVTVPSSPLHPPMTQQHQQQHLNVSHHLPLTPSSGSVRGYLPTQLNNGLYGSIAGSSRVFSYPSNGASPSPSSSSGFSPRLDSLPMPFRRSFSGDLAQSSVMGLGMQTPMQGQVSGLGQGQGHGLSFPSLNSFGGLRVSGSGSSSNSNLSEAFSIADGDNFYPPAQGQGQGQRLMGGARSPLGGSSGGYAHQSPQVFSAFQPQASPVNLTGEAGSDLRPPQFIRAKTFPNKQTHTQPQVPSQTPTQAQAHLQTYTNMQQRPYINTAAPSLPYPPQQMPYATAPASAVQEGGREGIEADMLVESAFTSVTWLRQHEMHMYRWAGDAAEWTEYAMHLPLSVLPYFSLDPSSAYPSVLTELLCTGCKIWVDKEILMGREASFLVFERGAAGMPSNICMTNALDLLSSKMRILLPLIASQNQNQHQIQSQPHSLGSIGSKRTHTPPSSSVSLNNLTVAVPARQSHLAWGAGPSLMGMGIGVGPGIGVGTIPAQGQVGEEEERSIVSDEYYDPEDLALSLSMSMSQVEVEGSADIETLDSTDWSTVPLRRNPSVPTRRPEPLKLHAGEALGQGQGQGGGYVLRWLEIPRDSVGLVIGQGGKKIKDLCSLSGAKIQFRVNKTAEREGRPGLLELQGAADNVDQGLQLVWDLLHALGKEYQEVPVQRAR